VLFVDEIHRWNKAQQDALLPHVESGLLTLIGATTENPSFQIIAALRSRCRLVSLRRLEADAIGLLLERALQDSERGLGQREFTLSEEARDLLAHAADGDARRGLRMLEDLARGLADGTAIERDHLLSLIERIDLVHDRDGDAHYDVVSAYIKSMRGSDPDAAIYWLARMLAGGEPAEFIARRLIIFAAEDVGNADPNALRLAISVADGVERVGLPEARLLLAQGTTYCAAAPKSDASYQALKRAQAAIERSGSLPVPLHLRNAATRLMKKLGHGRGYENPHRHPGHIVAQNYLPDGVHGRPFYEPVPHGAEKTLGERLAFWKRRLSSRP
jgi:putative ATPase